MPHVFLAFFFSASIFSLGDYDSISGPWTYSPSFSVFSFSLRKLIAASIAALDS